MVSLSSSMTSVLNILNPTHTSEQGRSQFYCTVDDNQLWYCRYRSGQSWPQCLRSVLTLHNETLNIWTHLLGFFFFLSLLLWDWVSPPIPNRVTWQVCYQIKQENRNNIQHLQDFAVILFIIGCYQICMIMSALFHTFSSHSQNAHELCLMMDLSGIMASITASFLCGKLYKGQ